MPLIKALEFALLFSDTCTAFVTLGLHKKIEMGCEVEVGCGEGHVHVCLTTCTGVSVANISRLNLPPPGFLSS